MDQGTASAQAAFPDDRRLVVAVSKAARMLFFIAEVGPEEKEKPKDILSGIVFNLSRKCDGNVHNRGFVEVTESSVYNDRSWVSCENAVGLGPNSCLKSENEPGVWICFDFKAL
jgi:hypothetical protein